MTRLQTQHQRLYRLPDASAADTAQGLGQGGQVRAMVLGLRQPATWAELSAVWRGVQTDLEWPAPAIAVDGVDAFELWFSLAEAVPAEEAAALLLGLCQRYLPQVKPARLRRWPTAAAAPWSAARIPALQAASGGWSAFVAPDLPAVFGDEPMLDFQPGDDAQAELLRHLTSIRPAEWRAALATLQAVTSEAAATPTAPQAPPPAASPSPPSLSGLYQDPRRFLFDVMNDPTVALASRIEAAKALLASGTG